MNTNQPVADATRDGKQRAMLSVDDVAFESEWESNIAPEDDVLPKGLYVADILKGAAYQSSGGSFAMRTSCE